MASIGEWLQLVTGKALLVTIGEWASQPANGPVFGQWRGINGGISHWRVAWNSSGHMP
jgi:hypothetical protein